MALSSTIPVSEQALSDPIAEFDLDVTVTTDATVGYTVRRCDGTYRASVPPCWRRCSKRQPVHPELANRRCR